MKTILWLITGCIAFTAIVCGFMMIKDPGGSSLQLSLTLLQHAPFKDFTVPGIVLLFIVGGSNAIASIAVALRRKAAFNYTIAAGLFISAWIIVQVMLTGVLFWLQFVYLAAGLGILLLSFHLKEDPAP